MKQFCKRGLSLFLALVLFAGLLSGLSVCAAAAETSVEERGKQAVAVALAYFDKGHSVQYDGKTINTPVKRAEGGKSRSTNCASPEYATPHETMYTVCSDFAHQVYWEAFRYDLLGKGPGYLWTGSLSNAAVQPENVVWSHEPAVLIKPGATANAGISVKQEYQADVDAAIAEMYEIAQPGDVFTAFGMKYDKTTDSFTQVGGHTMIWAGDVTGDGRPDIIHSGGKHMIEAEQIDRREYFDENDPDYIKDSAYYSADGDNYHDLYSSFGSSTNGGSIRIADAKEYIDERYVKVGRRMTLRRPALAMTEESHPVREASQYRVEHPGLAIDRTLNKTRFNSTFTGETVTMSLVLSNNSNRHVGFVSGSDDEDFDDGGEEVAAATVQAALQSTDAFVGANATVFASENTSAAADIKAELQSGGESYTVTVRETAPEGARIKTPFEGATLVGDTMTLDVALNPGETVTLTAEFEITAALGEQVVFDGGFVGDIPSNVIPIQVGGQKLNANQQTKLAKIANGEYNSVLASAGANNVTLGAVVYEKILEREALIPTQEQVASKLMKRVLSSRNIYSYYFLPKESIAAEDMPIYRNIVQTCWGGMYAWYEFGHQRCSDPRDMHLEPGDIVVRSNTITTSGEYEQLVYLGNGKYLSYDSATGTYPIVNEREFFRCLFYKIFYVVRPTLQSENLYSTALDQSWSLNLNDNVVINYYLNDEENRFTQNSYVTVDGERVELVRENGGWYLPISKNAAKQMGKQSIIQLTAVDTDGETHYGKQFAVSARTYVSQLLDFVSWDDARDRKLGQTMIAMLNYGAEAQKYFNYETGDLANKNLTAADQAKLNVYTNDALSAYRVNMQTVEDPTGMYYASSCVLGSSQALRFYLYLPESRQDRAEMSYRVHFTNYNGKARTVERSFAELTPTDVDGVFYFEVPEMAAADVRTNVTLTVKKAGSTVATITDSIASYCARVYERYENARDLTDAVMVYGLSARDYFFEPRLDREENEMPIY